VVAFNSDKGIFGLNFDLREVATLRVLGTPGLAVITILVFVDILSDPTKDPVWTISVPARWECCRAVSRWNSCRQGCCLGFCNMWIALSIRGVVARLGHCRRNGKCA
jgi:hypothetical protein